MRIFYSTALAAATVLAAGCESKEYAPPDRAERVRLATAAYAPSLFDTVSWGTEEERELEGNQVYVTKCRNCHGPLGRGDTEYARGRGLVVPSLVEAGWTKAHVDSVRRAVYVGHESGMPVFGTTGLPVRAIDAVAVYVVHVLRPDVLGPPPTPLPRR